MDLDSIDRELLQNLQNNARMTSAELAEQVELSPSGVKKRIRKLEEAGLIQKYVTLMDRGRLGFDMLCFVQVSMQAHAPDSVAQFDELVQDLPEILECHRMTGSADYLLKVVVRNREHLDHFLMNVLMPLPMTDRIRTNVVLKEIKETTNISINGETMS